MDALFKNFISETQDMLDELEEATLSLEKEFHKETVDKVFRFVHTIKGNSGLFELKKITELAHKFETVLNKIRSGALELQPQMVDLFLGVIDLLRQMVSDTENGDDYDIVEIIENLNKIQSGEPVEIEAPKVKEETAAKPKKEKAPIAEDKVEAADEQKIEDLETEEDSLRNITQLSLSGKQHEEKVEIFCQEIQAKLDAVEDDIVSLEEKLDLKIVHSLSSFMRKIFETSLLLKINHLKTVAGNLYVALELINKGLLKLDFELIDLLLMAVDLVRNIVSNPEEEVELDELNINFNHLNQFQELASKILVISKEERLKPELAVYSPGSTPVAELETEISNETTPVEESLPEKLVTEAEKTRIEDVSPPETKKEEPLAEKTPIVKKEKEEKEEKTNIATAKVEKTLKKDKIVPAKERPVTKETHLKVLIELINELINLAGETVIARNELIQKLDIIKDTGVDNSAKRISNLISRLQEGIMRTHMQPLEVVFHKIPRIVRDIERATGKKVNLSIKGGDIDLDKTIIDIIVDPIMHMVRNAVDHAIEPEEERLRLGKTPEGNLEIAALLRGGNVILNIQDDGRGFDTEKIKQKAINQGMISEESADKLDKERILDLIFEAGFSTAETVTTVSGRGVGMDVVRSNINEAGGNVEINSELGKGSLITASLPQTLSIITCLIIRTATRRFALAQQNIDRLILMKPEQISIIENSQVYKLDERLIPLFDLADILEINLNDKCQIKKYVAVVKSEQQYYGLVIDEIINTEEIVIKPLGNHFLGINWFSGATIMGDGEAILILDIPGMARELNLASQIASIEEKYSKTVDEQEEKLADESFLIFEVAEQRFAVSATSKPRIEKIELDLVKNFAGFNTICYRDIIIPLLYLEDYYHFIKRIERKSKIFVIIFTYDSKMMGIIVDKIINVVDRLPNLNKQEFSEDTVEGSSIIDNQATLILNSKIIFHKFFQTIQQNLHVNS